MRQLLLILSIFTLAACAKQTNGNAFDAVALFQLGSDTVEALPPAQDDEIVIRYGGWSLNELMQTDAGKQYLQYEQEDWSKELWANAKPAPGIYHLKKGQSVPVAVFASALLADQMERGELLFNYDTSRFTTMVDDLHCDNGSEEGYVGMYLGEGKLWIDKGYCSVLGGGVWEATR